MALGARQAQVMVAVLRQSLGAVAAGLALGILGALAAGRAMSSILYGVSRNDPATFALTAAAVAGVAALACYLPARRASRLDPLAALRSE
jgi:ABC-type antimicrobial peptide transport system permease subunit